jgi:DNA-binding NtrC family response regulator
MAIVLIIDDQEAVRSSLEMFFDAHGIAAEGAATPADALLRVRRGDVAMVLQDMNFRADTTSGEEGIALFRAIRALDPAMPVILITAWTSLETAVALVKEGATDYVAKPWDDEKLLITVRTHLKMRALERENARLKTEVASDREALAASHDLCGLVYESQAMHRLVSLAVQVAPSDAPILIRGPNGAGKEKLAEIVHAGSRRRDKPLVRVNAGALPEALIEGELFGSEAGAYTGATRARAGLFEAAHGGTLFLDEIANLPLAGQVKVLRVLQTGELQRLGSATTRKVDVRVISATNADLRRAIEERTFREDLYFRLNVVELGVPELKSRPDDILPLARHFLAMGKAREGKSATLSQEAQTALLAHPWPGNVRELENRIRRALLVAGAVIEQEHLGLPDADLAGKEPETTRSYDRAELEAALQKHGWNVSKAAAELGLSRQALYRRLEKLAIVVDRKAKP